MKLEDVEEVGVWASPARRRSPPQIEWNEGMPQHNTTFPAGSHGAYDAARRTAGLIDRSDRAHLVVSGKDRAAYLQGLLTNDVEALRAGDGCYAAYLTAQGRMIADVWVYELGDVMLLSLHRDVRDTVLAKFDQLIFSEDVQLGDVTDTFGRIAVVGPDAARIVGAVLTAVPRGLETLAEHGNLRAQVAGAPAIVLRVTDTGEPGFEVLVDAAEVSQLKDSLQAQGAVPIDRETCEVIRIEGGVPKFHLDMDEETIPLEAGLESRAISQTKGCYVGQEVIIRVLHRGHGRVARKLVGLAFDGVAVPPSNAVVRVDSREIGRVTSAALSPALQRAIALAYVHRDFVEAGTKVTVNDEAAMVTTLPFLPRPLSR